MALYKLVTKETVKSDGIGALIQFLECPASPTSSTVPRGYLVNS